MRWVRRLWDRRRTMRRRLEILEGIVEARDARVGQLEATVAAYERAATGTEPPSAATGRLKQRLR